MLFQQALYLYTAQNYLLGNSFACAMPCLEASIIQMQMMMKNVNVKNVNVKNVNVKNVNVKNVNVKNVNLRGRFSQLVLLQALQSLSLSY